MKTVIFVPYLEWRLHVLFIRISHALLTVFRFMYVPKAFFCFLVQQDVFNELTTALINYLFNKHFFKKIVAIFMNSFCILAYLYF